MYWDKSFWMNFIITNHTLVGHSVVAWNEFWLKQSWNNLGYHCRECVPKQFDLRITSRFSHHTCSNETNIAVLSDPSQSSWQKLQWGSHSVHEFDMSRVCFSQTLWQSVLIFNSCPSVYSFVCTLLFKCSFNVLSVF